MMNSVNAIVPMACVTAAGIAAMPRTTKPRWLTLEYATSFFMSGCTIATSAP